jgi:excisionase family DNA binding protein
MIKNTANYLTSLEASKLVGVTPDHIRKMILRGKIKALKLGHNWLIQRKELAKINRQRFPRKKEITDNGSS